MAMPATGYDDCLTGRCCPPGSTSRTSPPIGRPVRGSRARRSSSNRTLRGDRTCRICGYEPRPFAPQPAIAELAGLADRWVSLWHGVHPAGWASETTRPSSWSVVAHAGRVRDALHAKANRIELIRDHDDPVLDESFILEAPVPGAQSDESVLAGLRTNAARIVAVANTMDATTWFRTGRRGREELSALELLHEAVHEGVHHLWQARQLLPTTERAR